MKAITPITQLSQMTGDYQTSPPIMLLHRLWSSCFAGLNLAIHVSIFLVSTQTHMQTHTHTHTRAFGPWPAAVRLFSQVIQCSVSFSEPFWDPG